MVRLQDPSGYVRERLATLERQSNGLRQGTLKAEAEHKKLFAQQDEAWAKNRGIREELRKARKEKRGLGQEQGSPEVPQ